MAYMNQQKKAQIAAQLKPVLKKYGVKGSLSVRNHSTIQLTIKSGEIDFISNYEDCMKEREKRGMIEYRRDKRPTHLDVNVYWYKEHFAGRALEFLQEAMAALRGADWFDKSDIQSDYFHTAYYIDIHVGNWNKPYQLTA